MHKCTQQIDLTQKDWFPDRVLSLENCQDPAKLGWVGFNSAFSNHPSNIHPTSIQHPSIHPIKFILQLICISVMCSCTLVSYGSNCKAQTRFSSSWAELALVCINLTTHPPTTPPYWTVYFSGASCLIESIEACVACLARLHFYYISIISIWIWMW